MERRPPQPNDAYQHWLDDAAQMGLMLYRMRNDSKRERIVRVHHRQYPPLRDPPDPQRIVVQPPPPPHVSPGHDTTTPRTAALQIPTVATTSSSSVPVTVPNNQ